MQEEKNQPTFETEVCPGVCCSWEVNDETELAQLLKGNSSYSTSVAVSFSSFLENSFYFSFK